MLAVALFALFAVPARSMALAMPTLAGPGRVAASAAVAAAAALIVWRRREALAARLRHLVARLEASRPRRWLVVALALGLALRFAWMAAAPTPFRSDGLSYARLAEALAVEGVYRAPGEDLAFWPPGYPLALVPFVVLLGDSRDAVLASNLVLYALLVGTTWWFGRRALGDAPAALACLLLAVWPNLVALAAVPAKELLVAVLLLGALSLLVAAESRQRASAAWGLALAGGAALGAATLVQPGLALLALPLAGHALLAGRTRRVAGVAVAGLALGASALVLPWMLRNQRLLGAPVLGTAAGLVFFLANNPRATGEHVAVNDLDLAGLPELERSRRGFELGRAWISENPGAFARLAMRKLVVFLGDDADGVYHTLRERSLPRGAYALAKGVAQTFWWALWLGVLLGAWTHGRAIGASPWLVSGVLALLYLGAVHAVFEAGGRHHVPLAPLIALLAVSAASGRRSPEASGG